MNNSIKMEVGIEDCLHIEFEYNKSKWDIICFLFFHIPLNVTVHVIKLCMDILVLLDGLFSVLE
jgi:hypothetical protein